MKVEKVGRPFAKLIHANLADKARWAVFQQLKDPEGKISDKELASFDDKFSAEEDAMRYVRQNGGGVGSIQQGVPR